MLLIFLVALTTSCAYFKTLNVSALKIGMTKTQAEQALKKKPYATIAARNYPETNTVIEVVEFNYSFNGEKTSRYWLYFVNDKLDRWEPASSYHNPDI